MDKVYRVMREQGCSYREACRRVGRAGGRAKSRKQREAEEKERQERAWRDLERKGLA